MTQPVVQSTNSILEKNNLSQAEKKALAALDMPALLAALQDLIAIPSVTGSPEESEAQRWFARLMQESG